MQEYQEWLGRQPDERKEIPAPKTCRCGECGACVAGIDLAQKDQREKIQPARSELAARVEAQREEQERSFASASTSSVQRTAISDSWKQRAREWIEERDSDAFKLRAQEEFEDES